MKAYKSKETVQREKLHKNLKKRASKECSTTPEQSFFSKFSCMFLNPNNFSNLNCNCSYLLDTYDKLPGIS